MKTTALPISEEVSSALRELTSGGQPVVLADPAGAAVAVVLDLDSYQEARELVADIEPVLLTDPSGHPVGVVLDPASYRRAEAACA